MGSNRIILNTKQKDIDVQVYFASNIFFLAYLLKIIFCLTF